MKAFLVFRKPGDTTSTVIEADYFNIEHGVLIFYRVRARQPDNSNANHPILALSGQNWSRVESVEDLRETHLKYEQIQGGEKTKPKRRAGAAGLAKKGVVNE